MPEHKKKECMERMRERRKQNESKQQQSNAQARRHTVDGKDERRTFIKVLSSRKDLSKVLSKIWMDNYLKYSPKPNMSSYPG